MIESEKILSSKYIAKNSGMRHSGSGDGPQICIKYVYIVDVIIFLKKMTFMGSMIRVCDTKTRRLVIIIIHSSTWETIDVKNSKEMKMLQ